MIINPRATNKRERGKKGAKQINLKIKKFY